MTATNQFSHPPVRTTHVSVDPLGTSADLRPVRNVNFHHLNPYAYTRATQQFFTASDAPLQQPTEPNSPQERVIELREAVRVLATLIDMHVPKGRQRSLAMTALEDVQMRANRGIFAPAEPPAPPTPVGGAYSPTSAGGRAHMTPQQRLEHDLGVVQVEATNPQSGI